MYNEPFTTGSSPIHRTDPRTKILCAVLYSIIVAVSYRFGTLIFAAGISIGLVILARLNLTMVLKRLGVVIGFLVLIWIVLPITFEGDPLYRWGPLTVTRPGVILSGQITLKSISILLALMALLATIPFATLGHALERLGVPRKIVYLLLTTYRYIFVIEQEYQRLLRASKIRGFKPQTNVHTYRTFAYFVGMLFVKAAARAQRVYQAMKCRGFNGRFYTLVDFSFDLRSRLLLLAMLTAITILIYLEWFGS